MNILDENLPRNQRQLLESWRIHIRHLAVDKYEAAIFARRVLRHSEFDTQAKRMGKVVRASRAGMSFWRLHAEREIRVGWEES